MISTNTHNPFKYLFIATVLLSLHGNTLQAQVNTETMRKFKLREGVSTSVNFNHQISQGNSDFIIYKAQVRLDYLKKIYHTFFISSFKHGEQDDKQFLNKGFLHWRGLRLINDCLSAELFAQLESDDFINLKRRKLIGSGFRIRTFNRDDRANLFIGIGVMREQEKYSDPMEVTKNLFRSTNYVSGKFLINELVDFFLISYYQVAVNSITDFRILMDCGLTIKLWKKISLDVKVEYRYDNEPLPQIKDYDINITNGIGFSFD